MAVVPTPYESVGGPLDDLRAAVAARPDLVDAAEAQRSLRTPLHAAAELGRADAVRLLLACGSRSLDAADADGLTPLHCAAGSGQCAVVAALLEAGSRSLDAPDLAGVTPLHAAARRGQAAVVEQLLAAGASATHGVPDWALFDDAAVASLLRGQRRQQQQRWRCGQFSRVDCLPRQVKLVSCDWLSSHCRWRLGVYPRGDPADPSADRHLSLYVEVPDHDQLPPGWRRDVSLCVAVVNQRNRARDHVQRARAVLQHDRPAVGFARLIARHWLDDPAAGFLVNDALVVDVVVDVVGAVATSVHPSLLAVLLRHKDVTTPRRRNSEAQPSL